MSSHTTDGTFFMRTVWKVRQWILGATRFMQVQGKNQATENPTQAHTCKLQVQYSMPCMPCRHRARWVAFYFVQFNTNSQSNLTRYCMIHTQA